jgi:hypothetical protein
MRIQQEGSLNSKLASEYKPGESALNLYSGRKIFQTRFDVNGQKNSMARRTRTAKLNGGRAHGY